MTTYGTIPTSSSPGGSSSVSGEYVSRAKDRIKAGLGSRRPWKVMFDFRSLNFAHGFGDALTRLRYNAAYFRMNYAIIVLLILFLSLLWHPISLIVLIIMLAAWLFLYFLRDEPLALFGRTVDDRIVLIVLGVVTIVLLFLTSATTNILVALLVAVVVVAVHATLRKTEDLHVDEENAGLMTGSSS
ncbi:PRA1 family protein F2-like [Rosa rugosa]|uniref:PRA1 family protein F2-like n=1 Tax=Rosa rugosa TaxID=74645 RepID=UPI002B40463A|nr:PRA1 family protein F2-like [Rosa rugosa]